jgi:hypothetical protein
MLSGMCSTKGCGRVGTDGGFLCVLNVLLGVVVSCAAAADSAEDVGGHGGGCGLVNVRFGGTEV